MNIATISSLSQKPFDYQQKSAELESLEAKADSGNKEQLEKVCQDFESILLNFMMKQMRNTVPEVKLISGGQAEEMFKDMQDQELSKEISSSSQFGLAGALYQQLSRNIS